MTDQSMYENLRKDYKMNSLQLDQVFEDPIRQFKNWFDQALKSGCLEANAMTLSTVNEQMQPDARIVLLKGIDDKGFRFYTNYESQKGQQLKQNNQVSLVFFWPELERQVRINGEAIKLSKEESTQYFHSRPRNSQIGAWSSPQSEIIKDRDILDERVATYQKKFKQEEPIPLPEFWGGYCVVPYRIEFWQGRSSRLHDRLRYTLVDIDEKKWNIDRLAP